MLVNRSGAEGGPVVLLLHGGGVAGWMWDSLRRHLEPTHTVLVPDLPGHGRSADEPYRSHAETVAELAQVLTRSGTGTTAVIGFSLGAQLAIELASTRSELVDRVMVVSAQAKAMPFTDLTLQTLGMAAPLARQRWFARLQARGSALEIVAGAGHGIPLQRPAWFGARAADWLSERRPTQCRN